MRVAARCAASRERPVAVRDEVRGPPWANQLADAATDALLAELRLYPKPGLVSFVDNGSHGDMTAATFLRSIASLRGYFRAIAMRGQEAAPFPELARLGIAAERRMMVATGGVNTHRGAIFTMGLLCAAAGHHRPSAERLRRRLSELWGADLCARVADDDASHGQRVARALGLRGARAEAAAGFPVIFDHAVPALRAARAFGLGDRLSHLQAFFVIMSELEDTNLVHRAGMDGLRYAREAASVFLGEGGAYAPDAIVRAERIHRSFVERRLSPGGAADALAAASWVVRICS